MENFVKLVLVVALFLSPFIVWCVKWKKLEEPQKGIIHQLIIAILFTAFAAMPIGIFITLPFHYIFGFEFEGAIRYWIFAFAALLGSAFNFPEMADRIRSHVLYTEREKRQKQENKKGF